MLWVTPLPFTFMSTMPEAGRVLEQVASEDSSEDVRKAAAQILQNQDSFKVIDPPAAGAP
jgi:hypothetical protein